MTTRNVRLSDDDIDRLGDWHAICSGTLLRPWEPEDDWLRDRLVEAKMSPSMDWPVWSNKGSDMPPPY